MTLKKQLAMYKITEILQYKLPGFFIIFNGAKSKSWNHSFFFKLLLSTPWYKKGKMKGGIVTNASVDLMWVLI